ncbi:hypothetical protein [Kribbella hippodromi]
MADWMLHAVDQVPQPLFFGFAVQFVLLVLCGLACAFVWLASNTN